MYILSKFSVFSLRVICACVIFNLEAKNRFFIVSGAKHSLTRIVRIEHI